MQLLDLRCVWLVPALLFVFQGGSAAQQIGGTVDLVEELVDVELDRGVASVSVVLVHRDSVLWAGAYGLANVWARTEATVETVYSTASTFKPVTATAVLRLAQRGRIDLDAPVNDYLGDIQLPDHPDAISPITLRHVLTHTSGLPGGAETVELWERAVPPALEMLVADLRPLDPPGARYRYSNPAYAVAALAVERVSGVDFESFVLSEVFGALGTRQDALFGLTPSMVERVALPYLPFELADRLRLEAKGAPGTPVAVPQLRFGVYPAGDAYLTPSDMGRFLGLHLNGGAWKENRVLNREMVEESQSPQTRVGSEHGLGWFLVERNGRRFIEHSGGYYGYSAYLIGDPASGFGAYLAANSMGDMTELAVGIVSKLIEDNR